jgi:rubrerythrin
MVGCDFYTTYYNLQKRILDFMQNFQQKIRSTQSYKFIENQATGNKTDIRDLIKQCPNCGLIWFRVEACPSTACGTRPSCFFDFLKNSFSRFSFKRNGKKIIL